MRYAFQPGQPKYFGVFKLRIDGGGCKTARSVAKEWMQRFEADLQRGKVRLPKNVQGFAFKSLAPDKAQSYNEKGVKGSKTIRFEYTVPNG